LSPLAFTASGHVTASKLTLGKTPANHLDVSWELTQDRLKIPGLKAELFGGKLAGSADVPFDPHKAGAFEVTFQEVDAAAAGAFEVKGSYPGPKKAAPATPPGVEPVGLQKKDRGYLRIRGLDLSRLAPELGNRSLAPLRGIVDVTFDYENDLSSGSGRVLVR